MAEEKPALKRGSRFTLEAIPKEWVEDALRIQPAVDAQKVFELFADYWSSVPGKKGVKADWRATWRNWLRRMRPSEVDACRRRAGAPVRPTDGASAMAGEGRPDLCRYPEIADDGEVDPEQVDWLLNAMGGNA